MEEFNLEQMKEELKEELKTEILKELEESRHSMKRVPALEAMRKKWFHGPNPKYPYSDSKMYKIFGGYDQHKVWDTVCAVTRLVFQVDSRVQLRNCDQDKVEHVADVLFETVYSLRKEIMADSK